MSFEDFLEKMASLSKSAVSVKERKMIMEHVERHIDLLTVEYPQELEFLKAALKKDLLLIVQKFKRIFPIKPIHKLYEMIDAAAIQKYKNNYKRYNLEDPQPGVYSKYLKLGTYYLIHFKDLSFKVDIDVGKLIQCKWTNLIELNLKYCEIADEGWDYIMSVVPDYK